MATPETRPYGHRIKLLREAKVWTVEELAKQAKLSLEKVADAEAGKSVERGDLQKLARALSLPPDRWEDLTFQARAVVKRLLSEYSSDHLDPDHFVHNVAHYLDNCIKVSYEGRGLSPFPRYVFPGFDCLSDFSAFNHLLAGFFAQHPRIKSLDLDAADSVMEETWDDECATVKVCGTEKVSISRESLDPLDLYLQLTFSFNKAGGLAGFDDDFTLRAVPAPILAETDWEVDDRYENARNEMSRMLDKSTGSFRDFLKTFYEVIVAGRKQGKKACKNGALEKLAISGVSGINYQLNKLQKILGLVLIPRSESGGEGSDTTPAAEALFACLERHPEYMAPRRR
jgi:transcriptional regulator with XRE-family HTH domain